MDVSTYPELLDDSWLDGRCADFMCVFAVAEVSGGLKAALRGMIDGGSVTPSGVLLLIALQRICARMIYLLLHCARLLCVLLRSVETRPHDPLTGERYGDRRCSLFVDAFVLLVVCEMCNQSLSTFQPVQRAKRACRVASLSAMLNLGSPSRIHLSLRRLQTCPPARISKAEKSKPLLSASHRP